MDGSINHVSRLAQRIRRPSFVRVRPSRLLRLTRQCKKNKKGTHYWPRRCAKDMRTSASLPVLTALRERVQRLERGAARHWSVLPFGIEAIDQHLPREDWRSARCMKSPAAAMGRAIDGAAAALFTAGIAARTRGQILWCIARQALFAPALAQAGALARPRDLCGGQRRAIGACVLRGRLAAWRARRGGRRGCKAFDDGVSPFAACRRRIRCHWHRRAPLAPASGGRCFRPANGSCHPLARQRASLDSLAGAGHRASAMAP